jgi:hypothetical protein
MKNDPTQPLRWERLLAGVWVPLLVALLVGAVALVSWSRTAAAERAHQDYVRREQRYAALVSSIRGFHAGGPIDEKAEFLQELNPCWLYCSDEVIRAGYRFLETVQIGASSDRAGKQLALGALVLAIRHDLIRREPVTSTTLTAEEFKILRAN